MISEWMISREYVSRIDDSNLDILLEMWYKDLKIRWIFDRMC